MIEQKIEALTSAIVALTATIAAAAGSAPAAEKTTAKTEKAAGKTEKAAGKTEKSAAASKHSRSEINAALNEVKENFDTAAAKAIIKGAGFDKMADITEDKFDGVYEACKSKMAELSGDGAGEDDDGM